MEIIFHIQDGSITNKKTVSQAFTNLDNGRYVLKIIKSNKRSLNQNAYYHGVVVPMVLDGLNDIGYNEVKDVNQVHEMLKYLFLKRSLPNINDGEAIQWIGSTADLTTTDFMAYIADIQQWATEYLNIYIPDPNEQIKLI